MTSRITIGKIVLGWAVFLWCAAIVLPPLDSHVAVYPVVKTIVVVAYTLFFIGTPIALANYFTRAWRRVATVPNKTAYVIWMSLESIAGAGLFGISVYATVSFATARFR